MGPAERFRCLIATCQTWASTTALPALLKEAGASVVAFSPGPLGLSNYISEHIRASRDAREAAARLCDLLLVRDFDWLIVGDEDLLRALVECGAPSLRAKLPIDPLDARSTSFALSKHAFATHAPELSIPTPPGGVATSIEAAAALAAEIGYPVVVKGDRGFGGLEVRVVAGPSLLSVACEPFFSRYGRVLVQRFIEGVPVSACALYAGGKPLAFKSYRAECGYPSRTSASTVHASFRHRELAPIVAAVGDATRFHGMLGIDFMYEPRSDALYAIEINPRPTIAFGGTAANRAFFAPQIARFLRGESGPVVEDPSADPLQAYFPAHLFYVLTSPEGGRAGWQHRLRACLREIRLEEWRLAAWQIARFCYDELGNRLPRVRGSLDARRLKPKGCAGYPPISSEGVL